MKIVGLLSGGKDSILALMVAAMLGHEPVVLANLYADSVVVGDLPQGSMNSTATGASDENAEELDSFMFQTVGHSVVPSIAECLGLPLRRRAIKRGQSIEQTLEYSLRPRPDDEVEVLFDLLRCVKEDFPDIQGVVSGAILSNYQRLRVEVVCHRLGLVSLAPLWQMDASTVLELVTAAQIDARLIKVATFGLTPKKHIGRSLLDASLRAELLKLQTTCQLHAAGEGGEFESLVVDCPMFKRQRIELQQTKLFVDKEQPDVAALAIVRHCLMDKAPEDIAASASVLASFSSSDPLCAALRLRWMPSSEAIRSGLLLRPHPCRRDVGGNLVPRAPEPRPLFDPAVSAASTDSELCSLVKNFGPSSSIRQEAEGILKGADRLFCEINEWLARWKREPIFLLLVCPDMSLFRAVNKMYESHFEIFRPPGRAFLEDVHLPSLCVELWSVPTQEIVVGGGEKSEPGGEERKGGGHLRLVEPRQCLHVQSVSPWASATIGPYAQANKVTYDILESRRACMKPNEASCCGADIQVLRVDHVLVSGRLGMVPLTQELASVADLMRYMNAEHNASSSVEADEAQDEEGTKSPWPVFLAQFFFMMANSVVGIEHFKLPIDAVTHATFFVQTTLTPDAAYWIECAWGMYWTSVCGKAGSGDGGCTVGIPKLQWAQSFDEYCTPLSAPTPRYGNQGGSCAEGDGKPSRGPSVLARLVAVTGMPKGGQVEVILEVRHARMVGDED